MWLGLERISDVWYKKMWCHLEKQIQNIRGVWLQLG